jgi:hypothetical protein
MKKKTLKAGSNVTIAGTSGEITISASDKDTTAVPIFNSTTAYAIGDHVSYNNKIYVFTAVHSAGAWSSAQVRDISTEPTVSRSNATSTETLTAGGTVTIIDSITSDGNGHVTAVNTKTATLPTDKDTTYEAGTGILITGNSISSTIGDTKVGLNGATAAAGTYNFYAPADGGTSGNVLKSNGTSAPTWGTDKDTTYTAGTGISISGTTISSSVVNSKAFNGTTTAGTATAYTLAPTYPTFATADLVAGSVVFATVHAKGSAAATLNINNTAAKTIMLNGSAIGPSNELAAGNYSFTYDGANWNAKLIDTNTASTLNTNNASAQTVSASESLLSGTINLHKVAKTGTYSDLIGSPAIPAAPNSCTGANVTCSLNYGQCSSTENAAGSACSGAQYYWELITR